MHIFVIISDTLRRDHIGCYGNKEIRTPNIDRLAAESVVFDRCHLGSFPTVPMRADLYTGKYTFSYLGWEPLPREEDILPVTLKDVEFTTVGVVDTPFYMRNGYGYDRGFTDFTWLPGQMYGSERPRIDAQRRGEEDYCAPRTFAAAERTLEYYGDRKLFMLIDTWDPHEPWDPPAWYVRLYDRNYDGRVIAPCYGYYKERGKTEEDVRIAHACYCGEITMVDRWLGRFLEKIDLMGLREDSVIVFTSDHGYYFGEHGFFGKAILESGKSFQSPLYRELTRVPLMISAPGFDPGRVDALVSSVDIMPTITELAGLEVPASVQGVSLLPLMRRETKPVHDYVVSSFPLYNRGDPSRIVDDWLRTVEAPHFSTVTTDDWTFLYSTEADPPQLYDLAVDPGEGNNVAPDHPEVARELHSQFVSFLENVNTAERLLAPRRKLRVE